MANEKGLDLQDYSMNQLKHIVQSFKGSLLQSSNAQNNQNSSNQQNNPNQQNPNQQYRQLTQLQYDQQPIASLKQQLNKNIDNQQIKQNDIKIQTKGQQKTKPKVKINLKQMVIPQYKPPQSKRQQQSKTKSHPNNQQISFKVFKKQENQIKPIYNQQNKVKQDQKLQNLKLFKNEQVNKQKIIHKQALNLEKQQALPDAKQTQMRRPKSFYEQDLRQQYEEGFIDNNQNQYNLQNPNKLSYRLTNGQSIYNLSQNNKSTYTITKKANISSLYKQIKSFDTINKEGKTTNNFFDQFHILIKSFTKKQSNSIFKFPYVVYNLQTNFYINKQDNNRNKNFITNQNKQKSNKSKTWKVQRRFNDFKWLYQSLSKYYPGLVIPPIPSKTKIRSFQDEHLEQRMNIFQKFLNKCIHIQEISSDPIFEAFLSIQSREEFQAVRKKYEQKIKNRDQNVIQYIGGQQILSHKEGVSSISSNTKEFINKSSQLLQQLNIQLENIQQHMKISSQSAVLANNILRQLSKLHKSNYQYLIKSGSIFDVTSDYLGELSYKLDNQAYHIRNYITNYWNYEELYTKSIGAKIAYLQKHKNILQTKFKQYHFNSNSEMGEQRIAISSSNVQVSKNQIMYMKSKQIYDINLSLSIKQIKRHLQEDLVLISKQLVKGMRSYVDRIKEQMMTGVDLITKAITVTEGKELKQVQLISHKYNK